MKIVIDCRYLLSGIGRHLEGIIEKIDFSSNEYYLLGKKEELDKLKENFTPIYTDLSPFSVKGLLKTPIKEINKCDVFYTPNFIIPYGIKIKIYSTIHDVLFLDEKSACNGFIDKTIKKHLIKRCLKKSTGIFTVSNFTKNRIQDIFKWYKKEIHVIYNGISKNILNNNVDVEKDDSLVFVGNIKKHKGLIYLLEAMQEIDNKLIIIGNKDNFRTSDERINDFIGLKNVEFSGKVSDEELIRLVKKAKFLIQPSIYEGFGLPPLEAIFLGTKPIISDIEVFKEIYGNLDVEFFLNKNVEDLIEKIKTSNPNVSKKNIEKYNFDYTYSVIKKVIEGEKNEG